MPIPGAVGLLASAVLRRLLRRPLGPPCVDVSAVLAALGADVRVDRDEWGVAHVRAKSLHDVGVGVGAAMAADRLWQMDLLRRLGAGRLAEILGDRPVANSGLHMPGASVLAVDVWYRHLQFRAAAEAEYTRLSSDTQALLQGFAAGVSGWIAGAGRRHWPLEYCLTGLTPEPWSVLDSLVVGKLMAWMLSLAFPVKPVLARIAEHPALQGMLPPGLEAGACILGEPPAEGPAALDLGVRRMLGLAEAGIGSNGWVVDGRRTRSGKPILCNDPHLAFGLPALWYPVALSLPDSRVIGGTFPGVPAVLVGRNERLAWGMTAVMADDGDYYRETLDAGGERYRRGDAWEPVEAGTERFEVRGMAGPVARRLRYVRHEGVRCPLLPGEDGRPPVSYRWVGFEPWCSLDALLGMARARDVEEFGRSVAEFAVPAQNVVVADDAGTIAYFCAGRFPRRPRTGSGAFLLEGARPEHAWQGYLPWAEHPRAANPSSGILVTANNRVAPTLPAPLAGGFWEPPYRAARIRSLLDRCQSAEVESMARIQADDLSLQAAAILASVVRPVIARLTDPDACRAAQVLSGWDGRMTAGSGAAALFHLFYQALLLRVVRPAFEGQAPGLFDRYLAALHLAVPAVDRALLAGDPGLFGEDALPGVEASLADAWRQAVRRLGPEPSGWHWGALHQLTLSHPAGQGASRLARLLAWLFRLRRGPYPRPGDGMTVNLGAFSLGTPFAIRVGASYRQIVDLGDPTASRWVIAGGVSGDPRSPHYADQLPLWLGDAGHPMRFTDPPAASGAALHAGGVDCSGADRVL